LEIKYMQRALELAKKGKKDVELNPMVGAVIVKNNKVIAEGYHEKFGEAHAERNALSRTNESLENATMYVTLEPCSHYGKTPPCADLIIDNKLKRVVVASLDPNPLVAGKGIKRLKEAGVDVTVGILDEKNQELNKVFFKYIKHKIPFITLKTAMSLDGKIATVTGESKWISNEQSRQITHRLRSEHKAIMVGINTVLKDNPLLNCRLHEAVKQPIRVVIDTSLKIPLSSQIIQTAKTYETIIITSKKADVEKIHALKEHHVEVFEVPLKDQQVDLYQAMKLLGERGINSLLLEGGSALNFSALKQGLVDEAIIFIAPRLIGGELAKTPVAGEGFLTLQDSLNLELLDVKEVNQDIMLHYKVKKEV